MTYVIKKMRFPITSAECIKNAKDAGEHYPSFRADDPYIDNVIIDNIVVVGNDIEFTQIFRIKPLPLPNGITESKIIENAINIMKFYASHCENVNWTVYRSTEIDDKMNPSANIKTWLETKTGEGINNFKIEDKKEVAKG
ncbi:MAG: hypothetical protein ACFFE4_06215 [Candidatus Thorarchaeota archaeon]